MKKRKSILTMDEQLDAFLLKWQGVRAALVAKYSTFAQEYRASPTMRICCEHAQQKADHHQHELDMLAELRARSLGGSVS